MKDIIITAALSLLFLASYAQPEIAGKKWKIVKELSDEFKGKKIDESKWNIDPLKHPNLNWLGREPAIFKRESFGIKDGYLTIEAGKLPESVKIENNGRSYDYKYHGGILRSWVTSSIGHYYECRMKMNKTEMGGGFWLCHRGECGDKTEIDITESVGVLTEETHKWAHRWDQIMHSNSIHRKTACNDEKRDSGATYPSTKNHEKFYVYGFYWKSATELLFYLDGEYQYTLTPPIPFDNDLYVQFSIEAYNWNPIPKEGSMVATGTLEERTTLVDYIRVYKLEE
ncbi:LamG domain-containing protein [Reichenbachiella versicolor]|uniref:glycosyl hydrolase n=1 Tax=Reichenbachiella versicolor TaxID=1821036 RepID=UPI000D6E9838|nr:glycosyl hydrolase [Reichenbachiella versicolor]